MNQNNDHTPHGSDNEENIFNSPITTVCPEASIDAAENIKCDNKDEDTRMVLRSANKKNKANKDEAEVFIHEGTEQLRNSNTNSFDEDNIYNDVVEKILTPNSYINEHPISNKIDIKSGASCSRIYSVNRARSALFDEAIRDMSENVTIPNTTSVKTNANIDNIVQTNTGFPNITSCRDNIAASVTAQKPAALSQMKSIWGSGIVGWVKDSKDTNNTCYLCGQSLVFRDATTDEQRVPIDWDYPEVEHKIPCTTAFMMFPNMDNLRWYYPYYEPNDGDTSRATIKHRNIPGNKSMYAWWLDFIPVRVYIQRTDDNKNNPEYPENRYMYLKELYISINNSYNTTVDSKAYNNVKYLFKKFIEANNTIDGRFNDTVFNYAWNVICLWLMEFAGSHKICNQRKNQYNLMTVSGIQSTKVRTYTGGNNVLISKKKSVTTGLTNNLNNNTLFNYLVSITEHYDKCCGFYKNVSSIGVITADIIYLQDNTSKDNDNRELSKETQLAIFKRCHIWDNLRRIIKYVTMICKSYQSIDQGTKREREFSSDDNNPSSQKRARRGGGTRRTRRRVRNKAKRTRKVRKALHKRKTRRRSKK